MSVVGDNNPDEDAGSCQTGPHLGTYSIGGDAGQLICYGTGRTPRSPGRTSSCYRPEFYQWWLDDAGLIR